MKTYVAPQVIKKLYNYCNAVNFEVGGFLIGTKNEHSYNVTDAIILKHADALDLHFSIDDEAVFNFMQQNPRQASQVIGWWHSHVDFHTFYSWNDVETFQTLSKLFKNPIGVVVNQMNHWRWRYVDLNSEKCYNDTWKWMDGTMKKIASKVLDWESSHMFKPEMFVEENKKLYRKDQKIINLVKEMTTKANKSKPVYYAPNKFNEEAAIFHSFKIKKKKKQQTLIKNVKNKLNDGFKIEKLPFFSEIEAVTTTWNDEYDKELEKEMKKLGLTDKDMIIYEDMEEVEKELEHYNPIAY